MTGLEDVQGSAHIAFTKADKAFHGVRGDLDVFLWDHVVDQNPDIPLF